jgi:uncharacterized protein with beta-barrel porin domain
LTQISGEGGNATAQTTATTAMTQFVGRVLDLAIDRRGGEAQQTDGPTGYADTGSALAYADYDGVALAYAVERKAGRSNRSAYWASGFGGSSSFEGNATTGSHSTASSISGIAVGADYRVNRDTLVGFATGSAAARFDTAEGLGGGHADLFQFGVYGKNTFGAAYVAGALAYGWQDLTTDRIVAIAGTDHLQAEVQANSLAARAETGYRFSAALVDVTPYVAVQPTMFYLPSYAEEAVSGSNQFALAFASQTVTNVRTELGLRSEKSFALADGVLTLRGRAVRAHDSNTSRTVTPSFQSVPGSSFLVSGAEPSPNAALVSGGAEMKWPDGWSIAGVFEGEFSNTAETYAGKAVIRFAW